MDEEQLRASDAEREETVVHLREQLVAGRLTLEEFSDRAGAAYEARTSRELARLGDDLPNAPTPTSSRRPTRLTAGVFAHVVRRGRLRLRKRTFALSVFADVDLDLRDASIDTPLTTIRVFALFGNVDVYVPEHVDTDVGGFTVVGHRTEWGRDTASPGAPAVRVRIYGLVGTVDVWRVPTHAQGGYGAIIEQVRLQTRDELPPAVSD